MREGPQCSFLDVCFPCSPGWYACRSGISYPSILGSLLLDCVTELGLVEADSSSELTNLVIKIDTSGAQFHPSQTFHVPEC